MKRFRCISCGETYDENPLECPSCRQTDFEDRKPERKSKSGMIGIRMSNEELERFDWLVNRARKRNHLADKASVARELMGFPAVPQTITEEDREYFIRGEKVQTAPLTKWRKLRQRQERLLISKTLDLLRHGASDDPKDDNLEIGIKSNINSMWHTLQMRGPIGPQTKPEKKKRKLQISPGKTQPNVRGEPASGESPPVPG